jgi:hypothetical protein
LTNLTKKSSPLSDKHHYERDTALSSSNKPWPIDCKIFNYIHLDMDHLQFFLSYLLSFCWFNGW